MRQSKKSQLMDDVYDRLKYNVVEDENRVCYFDKNNQLHREDDKPAVMMADGSQYWYKHGLLQ